MSGIEVKKCIEVQQSNSRYVLIKSKYKAGYVKVIEKYNGDLIIEIVSEKEVAQSFAVIDLLKVITKC